MIVNRAIADKGFVAIVAALGANVGVAISKVVAFVFTHSSSMLAEAVHSFADSINEVLLLVGSRQAEREPTHEHPFGHARNRYVFAFVVAILLFFGSGVFALWQGVRKLQAPAPVEHPTWALAVLGIAMVLEGLALRTTTKRSAEAHGEVSFRKFVLHSKTTPELLVVLLEDMGAIIGLLFAAAGVIAAVVTGDGRYDGLATLAIGGLMVAISIVLWAKTRSLLVGEAAQPNVTASIERTLCDETITKVTSLRTQHLGPDHLLIAARVAVRPDATAQSITAAIAAAKDRVRAALTFDSVIYIEPELAR